MCTINGFVVDYGTILIACPASTLAFGAAVANCTTLTWALDFGPMPQSLRSW
jgi:hypothetical protein